MALKRENHYSHVPHYHIIFPVKYGKILLSEMIVKVIKKLVYKISGRNELERD